MKVLRENEVVSAVDTKNLEKIETAFMGGLPKDCTINTLPLFIEKQMVINNENRMVVHAPFVMSKNGKVISVELRPVSGLNRPLIKVGFTTRFPQGKDYKPRYKDFDSTKSIVDCVRSCYAEPIKASNEVVTTVIPTFHNKKPLYMRIGETLETPGIDQEKQFTPAENTHHKTKEVNLFKAEKADVLAPAALQTAYDETKAELLAAGLVTEEQCASWLGN